MKMMQTSVILMDMQQSRVVENKGREVEYPSILVMESHL